MPTFKTEALRVVSNVQLVKWLLLCNGQSHISVVLGVVKYSCYVVMYFLSVELASELDRK